MSKFLCLILSTIAFYTFAYISAFLLYQDLFEKRIPTKKNEKSLFYGEEVNKVNSTEVEPISNENFKYKFEYLDIDNTNLLDFSKYGCQPISFGYSQKDGKNVFPDYQYPECSQVTQTKVSKLQIDRKSNTLTLNCSEKEQGFYYSGPIEGNSLMKKENTHKIPLNTYIHKVNAESIEFGLGYCEPSEKIINLNKANINLKKKLSDCQHASMSPIFNKDLFTNSKKFVRNKAKIVFLLTLDSFSRRHFYRKLPSVLSYLNNSEQNIPDIALYDFQIHSTFGSDSVHNQVPIFAGKDYKRKIEHWNQDTLGEYSMWRDFKNKGYVTVMGFDDCDHWFPNVLGENPELDYSIRQFYCLVDKYTGVKTERNETEQRCVGPYQTHAYALNYTLELVKMYKGVNMWIYLHLNAAHEKTGQHAATLDRDLKYFLERFFEESDSEVLMFLGADHGMRYGHWYNTIDSYQETKLPSMFVLASKSLLDRYPYSYHVLSENSKRLTSKLDIRETILALIGKNENKAYSVNWLTNIASYQRNCEDLKSNILYCACSPITEIANYNSATKDMIEKIRKYTEKTINYKSYLYPKYPPGKFCDKVFIDKIRKFYHMSVDKETEIFKIEFGSSEFKQLKLEVNTIISSNAFCIDEENQSIYPPFNYAVHGYRYRVRIIQISRLDKYSGKCQSKAEHVGIPPDMCLRQEC